MRTFVGLFLVLFIWAGGQEADAHRNHAHPKKGTPDSAVQQDTEKYQATLRRINEVYVRSVKQIFVEKCMDCHSNQTRYPWFHQIPGVQRFMDQDIAEAKKHIDLSNGFPFRGHGSPREDLQAIRESVADGTMPPLRYKLMHWNAWMSPEEKEAIIRWTQESEALLESVGKRPSD